MCWPLGLLRDDRALKGTSHFATKSCPALPWLSLRVPPPPPSLHCASRGNRYNTESWVLFQGPFWACVTARLRTGAKISAVIGTAHFRYGGVFALKPAQAALIVGPALRWLWEKRREIAFGRPRRRHLCTWRATAPDGNPEAGVSLAKLSPRPDPGNTRRASVGGTHWGRREERKGGGGGGGGGVSSPDPGSARCAPEGGRAG